jgi:hypothetical protein
MRAIAGGLAAAIAAAGLAQLCRENAALKERMEQMEWER